MDNKKPDEQNSTTNLNRPAHATGQNNAAETENNAIPQSQNTSTNNSTETDETIDADVVIADVIPTIQLTEENEVANSLNVTDITPAVNFNDWEDAELPVATPVQDDENTEVGLAEAIRDQDIVSAERVEIEVVPVDEFEDTFQLTEENEVASTQDVTDITPAVNFNDLEDAELPVVTPVQDDENTEVGLAEAIRDQDIVSAERVEIEVVPVGEFEDTLKQTTGKEAGEKFAKEMPDDKIAGLERLDTAASGLERTSTLTNSDDGSNLDMNAYWDREFENSSTQSDDETVKSEFTEKDSLAGEKSKEAELKNADFAAFTRPSNQKNDVPEDYNTVRQRSIEAFFDAQDDQSISSSESSVDMSEFTRVSNGHQQKESGSGKRKESDKENINQKRRGPKR